MKATYKIISIFLCSIIIMCFSSQISIAFDAPISYNCKVGIVKITGMSSLNEDNEYNGFIIDYLKKIEEIIEKNNNVNIHFSFVIATYDELATLMENNQVDCITTVFGQPNSYLNTDPIISQQTVLLGNYRHKRMCYKDYNALQGLTVGYITQYEKSILEKYANEHDIVWTFRKCENEKVMHEYLKYGQINLLVSTLFNTEKKEKVVDFVEKYDLCLSFHQEDALLYDMFVDAKKYLELSNADYAHSLKIKNSSNNGAFLIANTREEQDYLNTNPQIIFACPNDHHLIRYNEEEKKYEGICAELAKFIAEKCGFEYGIYISSGIDDAINMNCDIFLGEYANSTVSFLKDVKYTEPIFKTYLGLWVKKDNLIDLQKVKRIAVSTTSESIKLYLSNRFPLATINNFATIADASNSVANGTNQILIINDMIADQEKNINNQVVKIYDESFSQLDLCFGINSLNPNYDILLSILNKSIVGTNPNEFASVINSNKLKAVSIEDFIEDNPAIITMTVLIILSIAVFFGLYHFTTMYRIAYYDSKYGMKNTKYLEKFFLKNYKGKNYIIAVIDISKMKQINTLMGVDVGDNVAKFVSEKFASVNTDNILITKDNSNNFIILMKDRDVYLVRQMILTILESVKEFKIGNVKINVEFHTGVYKGQKGEPVETSIRKAENALFNAKIKKLDIVFYDENIELQVKRDKEIENRMEAALQRHEFTIFMQPKYDTLSYEIVGAEALVRWITDERIIYPNDFIPLFERNGFVTKLDNYVFDEVCKFQRNLLDRGITPVPIAINQSRMNLEDTEYADNIISIADKYKIPYNMLEIEVTEYIYGNQSAISEAIHQMKDHGFIVSIDDFGSGYSSLNMLKNKSVDYIKLDKEFLKEATITEETKQLLKGIVQMAQALNIKTVCEGVETREQVEFLKKIRCDSLQGYYFSKPMSCKEFLSKTYEI